MALKTVSKDPRRQTVKPVHVPLASPLLLAMWESLRGLIREAGLMMRVLVCLRPKESLGLYPACVGASPKSGVSNSESASLGRQRRCRRRLLWTAHRVL